MYIPDATNYSESSQKIKIFKKTDLPNIVCRIFSCMEEIRRFLSTTDLIFRKPALLWSRIVRLLKDHSIFEQQGGYFFARSKFSSIYVNGKMGREEKREYTQEIWQDCSLFCRYANHQWTDSLFLSRRNNQSFYSAEYIVSGNLLLRNGNYYFIAERGDCILFQPHHDTALLHLPGEKVEFFGFIFTGELLPELFHTFQLDRTECVPVRDPDAHTEFCQSMLDAMQPDPDMKSIMRTSGNVYEFFQRLALEKQAQDPDDFADKVKEYLIRNFRNEIDMETLATLFQVCQTTLTNRFNDKFHQTPFQFLKQYRIEHAARLLVKSNLSGKEIAGLSGFFSPQHFCTEFQKYYGMSPGSYRRMFKRQQPGPVSSAIQDGKY